jgi:thioredoxin 1
MSDAPTTNHHPIEATDNTFEAEVLQADRPTIVDFWAPWCAPCRALAQTLDEVMPEMDGQVKLVKVNVDEAPQTAALFGIRSIPTLAFFKGGEALGGVTGALPGNTLRDLLQRHVEGRLETE